MGFASLTAQQEYFLTPNRALDQGKLAQSSGRE
jgi:hypothetical protein